MSSIFCCAETLISFHRQWFWTILLFLCSLPSNHRVHNMFIPLSQYLTNLMHKICFTISFISCLYMFRTHVLIIRRSKLNYTASGIITPIGVMIPEAVKCNFKVLFHASTCFEHMCSSSGGQNCITQPLV